MFNLIKGIMMMLSFYPAQAIYSFASPDELLKKVDEYEGKLDFEAIGERMCRQADGDTISFRSDKGKHCKNSKVWAKVEQYCLDGSNIDNFESSSCVKKNLEKSITAKWHNLTKKSSSTREIAEEMCKYKGENILSFQSNNGEYCKKNYKEVISLCLNSTLPQEMRYEFETSACALSQIGQLLETKINLLKKEGKKDEEIGDLLCQKRSQGFTFHLKDGAVCKDLHKGDLNGTKTNYLMKYCFPEGDIYRYDGFRQSPCVDQYLDSSLKTKIDQRRNNVGGPKKSHK